MTLPILMLTGNTSEEVLIECLASGANDFVTKPFRAPELLARVETLGGGLPPGGAVSRSVKRPGRRLSLRDAEDATQQGAREARGAGSLHRHPRARSSKSAERDRRWRRRCWNESRTSVTQRAVRIQRSAARMALMINDVLDFARGRLDSGVPISPRATDMRAICADIVDELGVANPGREIRLEVTGDVVGRLGPRPAAAGDLEPGGQRAGTQRQRRDDPGDRDRRRSVAVSVHNMGPAIPADELPRLFEAFRKARKAWHRPRPRPLHREGDRRRARRDRARRIDGRGRRRRSRIVVPRFPSK